MRAGGFQNGLMFTNRFVETSFFIVMENYFQTYRKNFSFSQSLLPLEFQKKGIDWKTARSSVRVHTPLESLFT